MEVFKDIFGEDVSNELTGDYIGSMNSHNQITQCE